jgi:hypothetical protein
VRTLLGLGLAILVLVSGCKSAAKGVDYRWSVKAPAQVPLGSGSKLRFTVETRTADGQVVGEVPYRWVVEWVGVHGSQHQGYSMREEEISAKGGPGTAQIRILAYDQSNKVVEVARASFEAVAETLPAK